jgi:hypothetical protein
MSVSYGGDSITFADGSTVSNGWAGFKNKLINGAMVIDQRNNGTALTNVGASAINYAVDRTMTLILGSGDGRFTSQRSSEAPLGFTNSLYTTVTTTDTSLSGFEGYAIQQKIEGYNIADLGFGTANAKTVTLSFWIRGSVVGTYAFTLMNDLGTQAYTATYTINQANTWEYKTITIPGSTTSTWYTDNNTGCYCVWGLGGATNRTATTTNTWTAGLAGGYTPTQASGCVSFVGNLNATLYITGVQLEKGSTASSFEYRPYGTELQLCQRYYYKWLNDIGSGSSYSILMQVYSSSGAFGKLIDLPVPMRTTPTATAVGEFRPHNATGNAQIPFTSKAIDASNKHTLATGGWSGTSGLGGGYCTALAVATNAYLEASAEL